MHINNPMQLAQLHVRYAQMEGANAAAQAAVQTAQGLARQYLDALGLLTGVTAREGQQVTVDWESGEVTVVDALERERVLNGVASG